MQWSKEKIEKQYNEYFPDEKTKAEAFDKIAERYYYANFGTMSKSDFETLLFSIYLERILEKHEENINMYSDYTLSKLLGVPQSRISSLKVRKELLYPYEKFDWKKSFERISDRAIYENGRIKLFIPDRNLYLELKNAIEMSGGFIEVQLTTNLLQVPLSYFLDLLVAISEEKDRKELLENIKDVIQEKNKDIEFMEKEPIGKALQKQMPKLIIDLISECIPVFGGAVKVIAENLFRAVSGDESY